MLIQLFSFYPSITPPSLYTDLLRDICIYIYIYIYMNRGQNQLFTPGTRIKVIVFEGALSLSSVLFKSTLNNANMQGNWLHGFRSKLPGMDEGALVVFAFATMLGSYLNSELERQYILDIDQWFPTVKRSLFIGLKWVYPSSGVPFSTNNYR